MNYKIIFLLLFSVVDNVSSQRYWKTASFSSNHVLAIRDDGTLWAWGESNIYGELGNGSYTKEKRMQMAAGNKHNKKFRKEYSKLKVENKKAEETTTPLQIGKDTDWLRVYTGHMVSFAIKSDSTLWAWGSNNYGALGDGTDFEANYPNQIDGHKWKTIAIGARHILGIRADGTLWAWGENKYGQLGDGTFISSTIPKLIGGENKWKDVTAGSWFSAAITEKGQLLAWGDIHYEPLLMYGVSFFGMLALNTLIDNLNKGTAVPTLFTNKNWVKVAAGDYHLLALDSDGELWAMGSNAYGQLGDSTLTTREELTLINDSVKWRDLVPATFTTRALDSENNLWTWGKGNNGQRIMTPKTIALEENNNKWKEIYRNGGIDTDGKFWSWKNFRLNTTICPQ